MNSDLLVQLQATKPLVVNYANFVTPGFVANGLNALGASPIMTLAAEEAEALIASANALVINLGTVNAQDMPLVRALAQAATDAHKPIILDPVAVGATAVRQAAANELLENFAITVIRGNAGEIAYLAGIDAHAKGIDAGDTAATPAELAQRCAEKYGCTVVVSGPVDAIASRHDVATVYNQTPLLPTVVGSGDLVSSVIGAYAGWKASAFEAALIGTITLGVAGELAAAGLKATQAGTFAANLLDTLTALNVETLNQTARYEVARRA